jgi:TonB family protein
MVDWSRHFWPAGITAFMLHGLIIATLALGMGYPPGAKQSMREQAFDVEMAFITAMGPEVDACQEQDRQVFDSGQVKQRSKDLTRDRPFHPLKKTIAKKASVGGASSPFDAQKKLYQGVMEKGDATPLYNPSPTYPREARRKKIQGVVFARLFVTALGSIGKVTILSPHTDLTLEEAVLRALPRWRFAPKVQVVDIPIEFRLD